jgi:Zn-dependent protease
VIPFDQPVLVGVALAVAIIPGVVLHEVSHGLIANLCGDPTARDAGRLTLNPVRHVDPVGTLLLPGILIGMAVAGIGSGIVFGYARPVPVDPRRLRRPRSQGMLVSGIGPVTNLLLAGLAALLLRLLPVVSPTVALFGVMWILTNVVLAVFNLLPVPPLDGSGVVAGLLPPPARRTYLSLGQIGPVIVFALLFAFPGVFRSVVSPVVEGILGVLL